MSLTCPNIPETVPIAIGSIVQNLTRTQMLTAFAGNVKTPTANFSAHYNGHTLSFRNGVPFVTTPPLLTALIAQSAPII